MEVAPSLLPDLSELLDDVVQHKDHEPNLTNHNEIIVRCLIPEKVLFPVNQHVDTGGVAALSEEGGGRGGGRREARRPLRDALDKEKGAWTNL